MVRNVSTCSGVYSNPWLFPGQNGDHLMTGSCGCEAGRYDTQTKELRQPCGSVAGLPALRNPENATDSYKTPASPHMAQMKSLAAKEVGDPSRINAIFGGGGPRFAGDASISKCS